MKLTDFASRKNILAIMLTIGVIQVAAYYISAMCASVAGEMPIAQPDTLLYCQAARRIVEGHAFSFSEGTAVSTGTTSVLYPFILAVPYALGATGNALLVVGFWLNALFYLAFLAGWGVAFCSWLEKPLARLTAAILLALACQPAYCAMAQSDIGAWLALSGLFAAGLATNRRSLYGAALIIGPWLRPEGMICVVAFGGIVGLRLLLSLVRKSTPDATTPASNKKDFLCDIILAAIALLSMLGVFALNIALTGEAQFSSVAQKGYFKQMTMPLAAWFATGDFLKILNGYILGLTTNLPRGLLHFPLLGAILLFTGIFVHPWRKSENKNLPIILLAALGGILTVANSQWQDSNFDRYIAWIMPLAVLFTAIGCTTLAERLPYGLNRILPLSLLSSFLFCTSITSILYYNQSCNVANLDRLFAEECEKILPKHASVGGLTGSGLAYFLSPRRMVNISGIYSPELYSALRISGNISILKNEPETRFDYWLDDNGNLAYIFTSIDKARRHIDPILTGPGQAQLFHARWNVLDDALKPSVVPDGKTLRDKVDIAYAKDEKRVSYKTIDRYGRPALEPFVRQDVLGLKEILDCGRVLVGGDELTVSLEPEKEATVVMRTLPKQSTLIKGYSSPTDFTFENPLSMRILVDGEEAGVVSVAYATNGFSDVTFKIPAVAIKQTPARLSFLGDHITCGYWFYQ